MNWAVKKPIPMSEYLGPSLIVSPVIRLSNLLLCMVRPCRDCRLIEYFRPYPDVRGRISYPIFYYVRT